MKFYSRDLAKGGLAVVLFAIFTSNVSFGASAYDMKIAFANLGMGQCQDVLVTNPADSIVRELFKRMWADPAIVPLRKSLGSVSEVTSVVSRNKLSGAMKSAFDQITGAQTTAKKRLIYWIWRFLAAAPSDLTTVSPISATTGFMIETAINEQDPRRVGHYTALFKNTVELYRAGGVSLSSAFETSYSKMPLEILIVSDNSKSEKLVNQIHEKLVGANVSSGQWLGDPASVLRTIELNPSLSLLLPEMLKMSDDVYTQIVWNMLSEAGRDKQVISYNLARALYTAFNIGGYSTRSRYLRLALQMTSAQFGQLLEGSDQSVSPIAMNQIFEQLVQKVDISNRGFVDGF